MYTYACICSNFPHFKNSIFPTILLIMYNINTTHVNVDIFRENSGTRAIQSKDWNNHVSCSSGADAFENTIRELRLHENDCAPNFKISHTFYSFAMVEVELINQQCTVSLFSSIAFLNILFTWRSVMTTKKLITYLTNF